MANNKKKRKKQPAKKRNKGILLTNFNDREIPQEKEEEECEEIFRKNLIDGKIINYKDEICTIEFVEDEEIKSITYKIDNDFLVFIKNIQFKKKKKYKKEEVTNIYSSFYPINVRDIEIDNLNLRVNRFPFFEIKDKNEIKFLYKDNYCLDYNEDIVTNYYKTISNFIKNLNSKSFTSKTTYRLLIGSEQSVYETSIRLHHIYGIPYIPSTAIKGVVKNYYIQKLSSFKFSTENNNFKLIKLNYHFLHLFGSQEQEGKIIFFDAFPTTSPKIKVDIMNPHYKHYYSEGKAPTDDKNPTPIPFLTVEDTKFKFFIASKEPIDEDFIKLFKEALQNHGIGSKTAVGYGYLKQESK